MQRAKTLQPLPKPQSTCTQEPQHTTSMQLGSPPQMGLECSRNILHSLSFPAPSPQVAVWLVLPIFPRSPPPAFSPDVLGLSSPRMEQHRGEPHQSPGLPHQPLHPSPLLSPPPLTSSCSFMRRVLSSFHVPNPALGAGDT